MKKRFTIIAITACALTANAQNTDSYKPFKGTVTTELSLIGGLGNTSFLQSSLTPNSNILTPALKFRYFTSDKLAIRLGFSATTNSQKQAPKTTTVNTPSPQQPTQSVFLEVSDKTSSFGINVGVEKHFKGSERLSTFVGGDILFGFNTSLREDILNSSTPGDVFTKIETVKNPQNYNYFGLGLVTGADYYIAKKVYLGVELGLQILSRSRKDIVTTFSNTSQLPIKIETKTDFNEKSFTIQPIVNAGIRIGYQF